MEIVELVTPSGHKIYLRPYLTYGDRLEIKKIVGQHMSYDMQTGEKDTKLTARAQYEAEEYAVKAMVQRLVEASGKEYTGVTAFEAIRNWQNPEDGDAVFAKMNELTGGQQLTGSAKKNSS